MPKYWYTQLNVRVLGLRTNITETQSIASLLFLRGQNDVSYVYEETKIGNKKSQKQANVLLKSLFHFVSYVHHVHDV